MPRQPFRRPRRRPSKIAFWATACTSTATCIATSSTPATRRTNFRVDGLMSLQFATIDMHWDLYGAELSQPGRRRARRQRLPRRRLRESRHRRDRRPGQLLAGQDRRHVDPAQHGASPERMQLDMRFAHIWVIKDERLDDWPPAGQIAARRAGLRSLRRRLAAQRRRPPGLAAAAVCAARRRGRVRSNPTPRSIDSDVPGASVSSRHHGRTCSSTVATIAGRVTPAGYEANADGANAEAIRSGRRWRRRLRTWPCRAKPSPTR